MESVASALLSHLRRCRRRRHYRLFLRPPCGRPFFRPIFNRQPVPVAGRSKTRVCGHSLAGTTGLKRAGDMGVCLL